jgi:O-antigen ligase
MTARVGTISLSPRMAESPLVSLLALALSVGVGVALVWHPVVALLPLAALVSALLLVNGQARIVFVLFGGLFVLQGAAGISAQKVAFLAVFALAFMGSLLNISKLRGSAAYVLSRPLIGASVVFAALGLISFGIANRHGTTKVDWLRDVTPYLLFASVPVFALDAQAVFTRKALVRLLVGLGSVSAISFAVVWLQRRGIATLPLAHIGLPSVLAPAALFAFAMAVALHESTHRVRWLALAGALVSLLVSTGTRSTLVLFVAPVAIAVASRRRRATRSLRLAAMAPVAVALAVLFTAGIAVTTGANTHYLRERVSLLAASGSTSDASANDRRQEGQVAWDVFKSSPIFGVGPGYLFEWTPQGGQPRSSFVMDTPLTFFSKFGIAGLLVLLFVVMRFWKFVRGLTRDLPNPLVSTLALVGYLGVVVASAALAPPFEDKGLSLGLILLLAIALADRRDARTTRAMRAALGTGNPQ